ncbi:MAG: Uncharacterised protein [Hyphomonas sp. TMED17]|nr:MAG: Uncharacterised protein [Hyphomonas sp. TMED17]
MCDGPDQRDQTIRAPIAPDKINDPALFVAHAPRKQHHGAGAETLLLTVKLEPLANISSDLSGMQGTDQREQSPCRIKVDLDLTL